MVLGSTKQATTSIVLVELVPTPQCGKNSDDDEFDAVDEVNDFSDVKQDEDDQSAVYHHVA